MAIPKRYNAQEVESRLIREWLDHGVYDFDLEKPGRVYSIDSPPATVSGNLHLGHTYSYSHPDFMARFFRMNGYQVFYPMGFDDNGLPTDRLVEKEFGITSRVVGREAYIEKCLETGERYGADYRTLWQRLGLSIDWHHTYRTIDERSQRIAQWSFLDLHNKDLVYRQEAPTLWCPECQTAIAQADLEDLERHSETITLPFSLVDSGITEFETIQIATTRPELLPACVAVFIHPDDKHHKQLIGRHCIVPVFGQQVRIFSDRAVDPTKGTGVVMCCTFGDAVDVGWWYKYDLPLLTSIDKTGKMTADTEELAGLSVPQARRKIKSILRDANLVLDVKTTHQSVRVHERCDTPVEYILTKQWFIRLLDHKEELLKAGESVNWHPSHMVNRYKDWVENLNWDWCISRQRAFGVPFPVWYCGDCGAVKLAKVDRLPIDPQTEVPPDACECGCSTFQAETDVLDTWATSSMTPQIAVNWRYETASDELSRSNNELYQKVFPYSLRPQAHEIIRTWAFYTIVKSIYHYDEIPWSDVMISGWGTAGEGMGKISKSRGGGGVTPLEMIDRYSADAVRYWAASTATGKDSVIDERKIQQGVRLVNKLWSVARFCERFFETYQEPIGAPEDELLSPADRWILSKSQNVIHQTTEHYLNYDYAAAKNEIELFFWRDLADNYLEMCKQRLYDDTDVSRIGALFALHHSLLVILKLFAPLVPFITEAIYQSLYPGRIPGGTEGTGSIHRSEWPQPEKEFQDDQSVTFGELLVEIATAVRRYKSGNNLPLGTKLKSLAIASNDQPARRSLHLAISDLASITRAEDILICQIPPTGGTKIYDEQDICVIVVE